jgi:hypothetical protein
MELQAMRQSRRREKALILNHNAWNEAIHEIRQSYKQHQVRIPDTIPEEEESSEDQSVNQSQDTLRIYVGHKTLTPDEADSMLKAASTNIQSEHPHWIFKEKNLKLNKSKYNQMAREVISEEHEKALAKGLYDDTISIAMYAQHLEYLTYPNNQTKTDTALAGSQLNDSKTSTNKRTNTETATNKRTNTETATNKRTNTETAKNNEPAKNKRSNTKTSKNTEMAKNKGNTDQDENNETDDGV